MWGDRGIIEGRVRAHGVGVEQAGGGVVGRAGSFLTGLLPAGRTAGKWLL